MNSAIRRCTLAIIPGISSILFLAALLLLAETAAASYRIVQRSEIESRSYMEAAPKIRIVTKLGSDLEGWLIAATDSSLSVDAVDNTLAATTPSETGTNKNNDPLGDSRKGDQGGEVGSGVRTWKASGFREISNLSILTIELDRSSVREFTDKPAEPQPAPRGLKPRTSAGSSKSNAKKVLLIGGGALAAVVALRLMTGN